jgi:sialic acid synthase SpsE
VRYAEHGDSQMIRMIQIDDRKIGLDHKPFIITKMSGKNNRSLEWALATILALDCAAGSGSNFLNFGEGALESY